MKKVSIEDIMCLVDDRIPPRTRTLFRSSDLLYNELDKEDAEILQKALDATSYGTEPREAWEGAWGARAELFSKSMNPDDLVPGYFGMDQYYRFQGRFIKSDPSNKLDYKIFQIIRSYVFEKYLFDTSGLHEFGCGTGYNLYAFAEMYPYIPLYGYDWTYSSSVMVNLFNNLHIRDNHIKASGMVFDMKHPDKDYVLPTDAGILTIGALEQLGNDFQPFINYLLKQNIKIAVHLEPIYEFYDPSNPFDQLQMEVVDRRGYLKGFLPYLEASDRIEVMRKQRVRFGSIVHEGWNIIVWRPKEIT